MREKKPIIWTKQGKYVEYNNVEKENYFSFSTTESLTEQFIKILKAVDEVKDKDFELEGEIKFTLTVAEIDK